ncbi:MAG: sulfatase-like hydrolase/transferase, partial [Lentisphaeraceae bacterium]|nr:sulfatase-like hydrolase/transferase [Lentisphaeraceae bacterium]
MKMLIAALGWGLLVMSTAIASPQNILMINMEDMGLQINPYGDYTVPTPNLNKLAGEGLTFNKAYVTQAACSPSRASFFTSQYPHQNGHMGLAKSGGFEIRKNSPHLLRELKKKNYYTGFSYKIHVDNEQLTRQYFDKAYDHKRYKKDEADTADYLKALEYMDEFLAERKEGQSFFYMAQTSDTHRPFVRKRIKGQPFEQDNNYTELTSADVKPLPHFGQGINFGKDVWLAKDVAHYYNAIQRVDAFVGGCMKLLSKYKLTNNTLVVFTADHGPCFGRGKLSCHELGVHVPMIIRHPDGYRAGEKSAA